MNIIKKIFLILIFFQLALFAEYPQPNNEYVNDFANIIDDDIEKELYKKLSDVEYYSGVEISIITMKDYKQYKTNHYLLEDFSTALFNHWGVGNTAKNNGVLLLISKNDKKIRIELGRGYSHHYNEIMKSIIDDTITPEFKLKNYNRGITNGIDEIIRETTTSVSFFDWYKWYILGGILAIMSIIAALSIKKDENPGLFYFLLSIAGGIIISIISMLFSGNSSNGFGGGDSDGGGASGSWDE